MFKKILASICIVTSLTTQIAFANNEGIMLISNQSAKDTFYEKHGIEKSADVFYNGDYIYFEDAQPLVLNGTTFVPIRNFCDALGAEVGYENETQRVTIKNGDDVISFVAGSADIDVNGQTKTLTSATFITDARTMVPARLISEAFDLDVSWNSSDKQVIINDINALKEMINNELTIVNNILEFASYNTSDYIEGNMETVGDIALNYNIYGTKFNYSGDYTSVADESLNNLDLNISSKIDANEYIALLDLQAENGYLSPIEVNLIKEYLKEFETFDMNMLLDLKNDYLYFSSDKMNVLKDFLVFEDSTINDDTTLKLKLNLEDILNEAIVSNEVVQNLNIEYIVDTILAETPNINHFDGSIYKTALEFLENFKDSNFTQNADTYVLSKKIDALDTILDVKIQAKLDSNGGVTSYSVEIMCNESNQSVYFVLSQNSLTQASCSLQLAVSDPYTGEQIDISLSTNASVSATDKEVSSIPTTNVVEIQ